MSLLPIDQHRNSYSPDTPQNESSIHTGGNYSRSPLANHFDQIDAIDSSDERRESEPAFDPPPGQSVSTSSTKVDTAGTTLTKSGTIKKKASLKQPGTLSRRSSKRSVRIASLKGLPDHLDEGFNNVFRIPVPTSGNPTEVLANRFQAWRKFLKDLIGYFREIQTSYETRAKALAKVSGAIHALNSPREFLSEGGLSDAIGTLRGFSKVSVTEANRAREIEEDVITQLNGLRNDLNSKMKEIKSLSGDFKNSVEKEKENTKRAVDHLRDALALSQSNPSAASGKGDPYIAKLAVDRQVEKQIDEENYLHRAYLNLEGSGRELEAIVVGEIQKAFNAYAGILKREYDHAHEAVDVLRTGPIAMPKDHEWESFVQGNPNFIDPTLPIRKLENIFYPGKFAPAAAEIRAGTLERKSKYLKSYTPGWYVLSPTHVHEFKSAEHLHTQTPVMSLCLLDQKLGSHSQPGASSHKFNLKGRQTGGMHRGHSWVFRAESYDIMMAWYEDIKALVEKTGEEKVAFMRKHIRIMSGSSYGGTSIMSGDGMGDDEADRIPFASTTSMPPTILETPPQQRPEPGGHFATEVNMEQSLQPTHAASAASSVYGPRDSMVEEASSAVHSQQNLTIPRDDGVERNRYSPIGTPSRAYGSQGGYGTSSRPSYDEHIDQPPTTTATHITIPQLPYTVIQPSRNADENPVSAATVLPGPYASASYASAPYTTNPYSATPYAATSHATPPYMAAPYAGTPYTADSYAAAPYTAAPHATESRAVDPYIAAPQLTAPPPEEVEYHHQDQIPLVLPVQSDSRPRTPSEHAYDHGRRQEFGYEPAPHEPVSTSEDMAKQQSYESSALTESTAQNISQPKTLSGSQAANHRHEFSHEPAPHEHAPRVVPLEITEPLNYNPAQSQEIGQQEQSYELPVSRSPPPQMTNSDSYLNGAAEPYHEEVGPTESAPGIFIHKQTQSYTQEAHAPENNEVPPDTNHAHGQLSSTHEGDAFPQVSKLAQSNGAPTQSAPSVSSTSDTDAASVIHLIPTPATEVYVGAPPSMETSADSEKGALSGTLPVDQSTQTQDFEEQAPRTSRFTEVGMANMQTGRWNGSAAKNGASSTAFAPPELRHSDTAATVMTVSDLPIPGKYISRG